MKTHKVQIVSHRRLLASLLLVIAVATWGTQVAESAQGRHRRPDFPDVNVVRDGLQTCRRPHYPLDIFSPNRHSSLPVVLWITGTLAAKQNATAFQPHVAGYIVVRIYYRLQGAPFPAGNRRFQSSRPLDSGHACYLAFRSRHLGHGSLRWGHLAALLRHSGGVAD